MSVLRFFLEYFLRWLPSPVEPGLKRVGSPGRQSPVLVTGNFSLTVRRVLRALRGIDAWLVVARSRGINVWCASAGGAFGTRAVTSALKTSTLAELVDHRTAILPQLSACAVDPRKVREQTGWECRFGPALARDIPAYLEAGMRKTRAQTRVVQGLAHRLEMLPAMNFAYWLMGVLFIAPFRPGLVLPFTVVFWPIAAALHLCYGWIPGWRGWGKSVLLGILLAAGCLIYGAIVESRPFSRWGYALAAFLVSLVVGFDVAGIVGPRRSEAEAILWRTGLRRLGQLMSFHNKIVGVIALERGDCVGCGMCVQVCPVGVFSFGSVARRADLARAEDCLSCAACVRQCEGRCLSIVAEERARPA